jgi:VTC domain-containing protein
MEALKLEHSPLARRRIERKYLLPREQLFEQISRMPHAGAEGYSMATVYLDRRDGALSWRALATPRDCTKLRIRVYGKADPYAWVELKTRFQSWTEKCRFAVLRSGWTRLLTEDPDPALLARPCPCLSCVAESKSAFHQFRTIAREGLVALGAVAAKRQSFQFKDVALRMTLDLDLTYHRPPGSGNLDASSPALGEPIHAEPNLILEVKHSGPLPLWADLFITPLREEEYSKFRTLLRCVNGAGHPIPIG